MRDWGGGVRTLTSIWDNQSAAKAWIRSICLQKSCSYIKNPSSELVSWSQWTVSNHNAFSKSFRQVLMTFTGAWGSFLYSTLQQQYHQPVQHTLINDLEIPDSKVRMLNKRQQPRSLKKEICSTCQALCRGPPSTASLMKTWAGPLQLRSDLKFPNVWWGEGEVWDFGLGASPAW